MVCVLRLERYDSVSSLLPVTAIISAAARRGVVLP